MSIFKLLPYIIMLLVFAACKPNKHLFNYAELVNNSMHKDSFILTDYNSKQKGIQHNNITAYRIYRATLKDVLVENNSVGEYRLINTVSTKERINKQVTGNYHELYLYLFNFDSGLSKKFALVGTGYNSAGECISVGPAYVGAINTGKSNPSLQIEYEVKVKKSAEGLYLQNNYRNKISFDFLSRRPIMPDNNRDSLIQFYTVLQNSKNKIGGMDKPLVFNVSKIFNDSTALTFKLIAEKNN